MVVRKERFYLICEQFLENKKITNELIISLGFSLEDIAVFLEQNKLVKKDNYYLISDDYLTNYGYYLLTYECDTDKAIKCFKKVLKINPYNCNAFLKLLNICLSNGNFIEAAYYLNNCSLLDDNHYQDNNFFLFLMSMIIKLPEEIQDYLKLLNREDYLLDESSEHNKRVNEIRNKALDFNFIYAFKLYNDLANKMEDYSNQANISRLLLSSATDKRKEEYNKLFSLLDKHNFAMALAYLEKISKKHELDDYCQNILLTLKALVQIISLNTIPECQNYNCSNIEEAIKNNDFEGALKLMEETLENPKSKLYKLLLYVRNVKGRVESQQPISYRKGYNKKFIKQSIIYYHRKREYYNALKTLEIYLMGIGKIEYINIFMVLLKLAFNDNYYLTILLNVIDQITTLEVDIKDLLNIEGENLNTLDDIAFYLEKKLDVFTFNKSLTRVLIDYNKKK